MSEALSERYINTVPIYEGINSLPPDVLHWVKVSFFAENVWVADQTQNDSTFSVRCIRANVTSAVRIIITHRDGRLINNYQDPSTRLLLPINHPAVQLIRQGKSKPHEAAIFAQPGEIPFFEKHCIPDLLDKGFKLAKGKAVPHEMLPGEDNRHIHYYHETHSFFFKNDGLVRDVPSDNLEDSSYTIGVSIRYIDREKTERWRNWYQDFKGKVQEHQIPNSPAV